MANQLKMAEIDSIVTLHKAGHSQREIARLLNIDRGTVSKYLSQQDGPKPAKPDHRVSPGPTSACEPYRATIQQKLEAGLDGQRIYQDLVAEHG